MIKSFTVTNYLGDSIKLELGRPEQSGFLIRRVSGLGPTKSQINTTELATNDGSVFNSAKLTARNIIFDLVFTDLIKSETIETLRQKTYKYFPSKKNLELIIETDNRIVKIKGYVESNEPDIFSSESGTQISILCPDPYFYSLTNNVTTFYGIEPVFEFPFSNESLVDNLIEFSVLHNRTASTVIYTGDAEVGVSIKLFAIGSVSNVTIYNTGTRESMPINTVKLAELTGFGIIANDEINISTKKGEKFIYLLRAGEYINILNCLDKNADWFHLVRGDNVFAYTAEEGIANLQFRVENKIVFEGI